MTSDLEARERRCTAHRGPRDEITRWARVEITRYPQAVEIQSRRARILWAIEIGAATAVPPISDDRERPPWLALLLKQDDLDTHTRSGDAVTLVRERASPLTGTA